MMDDILDSPNPSEPKGPDVVAELKLLEGVTRSRRMRAKAASFGEPRSVFRFAGSLLIWMIVAAVVALMIWASFADLDSVVRGQGQVIPDSSTQIVQSLEGGIVSEMLVSEGDSVEVGQTLLRINDMQFLATYRENLTARDAISTRVKRLFAEATGEKSLVYEPSFAKAHADLVKSEQLLFDLRRENQKAIETEIQNRIRTAEAKLEAMGPAIERGTISLVEKIELDAALEQLKSELEVLDTSFRRQAMELYDQEKTRLATLEEAIPADEDRLKRAVIKSPIDGTVNAIFIKTEGRVVRSGDPIMEIVPANESLFIECKLRPSDIAFIRVGMPAIVRFTAYDFAIYGGLKGTVETLGVDTVTGPEGEEFYPVKIRTESETLGQDRVSGDELVLKPGMVAEVDVITGKKTVMDYLLKPVKRAKQRALRER